MLYVRRRYCLVEVMLLSETFEMTVPGQAPAHASGDESPPIAAASMAPFVSVFVLIAFVYYFLRHRGRGANESLSEPNCSAHGTGVPDENKSVATEVDSLDVLPLRYCPICHSSYLPNTEVCEECSVELEDEPDEEPVTRPSIGNDATVRIARIPDPIQCNLVVGLLQNEGIPCVVSRATVWGNHGGDIYVLLGDAFHAKRLVRDYLTELAKEHSTP